jgi:hypothetical protein
MTTAIPQDDRTAAAVERMTAVTMADSAFNTRRLSEGGYWVRWWFLGAIGAHRWYVGDKGMAWLILCTIGGFFGVIPIIDAFRAKTILQRSNERIRRELFALHGLTV